MPQMDRPANGRELNAQSGAAADADDHGFYTFIRSARRFKDLHSVILCGFRRAAYPSQAEFLFCVALAPLLLYQPLENEKLEIPKTPVG